MAETNRRCDGLEKVTPLGMALFGILDFWGFVASNKVKYLNPTRDQTTSMWQEAGKQLVSAGYNPVLY